MRQQVIRILLRYLAVWLIAKGYFSSEDGSTFASDPDVAMLIDMGVGAAIAGATELWFWLAKPSAEAAAASKAIDKGQKVTIEGPLGGKTVVKKDVAK
mgnify:CR=1 FL=1